jgi:hypothetical protein
MRTLCLQIEEKNSQIFSQNLSFFTNKIKFRRPGLLFAEVTEVIKQFGNESNFMQEIRSYHKEFFPNVKSAIGKDPIRAQVLCQNLENSFSCPEQEETYFINQLPLQALHHFEGLSPWKDQTEVESAVTFFSEIGLRNIQELKHIQAETFSKQWGVLGQQLWRRIHGLEQQIITPQANHSFLIEQIEFNIPISLHSYLLFTLEKGLRRFYFQSRSTQKSLEKLRIYLYCKWNYDIHLIEIPIFFDSSPSDIYEELDRQISFLDLANPVERAEIELLQATPAFKMRNSWTKKQIEKVKLVSRRSIDHGNSVLTVQANPSGIYEENLNSDATSLESELLNTQDNELYSDLDTSFLRSLSSDFKEKESHEYFYNLFKDDNYKEDFFDLLAKNTKCVERGK